MASTRHSNEIGLYKTNPLITLNKLTTNRKVLQRFQQHIKDVTSIRNASHSTIDELYLLWSKATIPTVFKANAIKKLKNLHYKWLLLKMNKERYSEAQKTREQEFKNQLDMLFDVVQADALSKMQIPEDRLFLENQRSVRRLIIGAEDKKFTAKQKRIEQRRMKEKERRQKAGKTSSQTIDLLSTRKLKF